MKIRFLLAAAMLVAIVGQQAMAQYSNGNLTNNLFQQYYTPNGASQMSGGMYPAPHWVPGYVGATYYTYQPLQPHEMMYQHSRNYYNFQAGPEAFYQNPCGDCGPKNLGALNVTKVRWQSGVNHMGPLPMSFNPIADLHYRLASQYYCAGGKCGSGGGLLSHHGHGGLLHGHGGLLHGHGGRLHGHGHCPTGDCQATTGR